jgi:SlyX protein
MSDDHIEQLETKIAFQEDLLDELNKTVFRQQQKLERLEATCEALARHIAALAEAAKDHDAPAHEKPPHY